jgi:hypothetical protein
MIWKIIYPIYKTNILPQPEYDENYREEEPKKVSRDALFQRDYFDMVEIICPQNDAVFAGQLIKKLVTYVKTIGRIITM